MAFNFSVNAQNPMIGVLFVKIGIQLQLLIVLIGHSGELIQYGIGQLTKEKSTEKIDGAVATIMALDRAIRCGNDSSASVYDDRGILFI